MKDKDITIKGFFVSLLESFAKTAGYLFLAFAIGTGAMAGVCLYYGFPLVFSLVGGFVVLGIAVAIMAQGPFS